MHPRRDAQRPSRLLPSNTNAWAATRCQLVAGSLAGTSVDIVLFPIDTLKTRLQAAEGFRQAGGFAHLEKGILAAAAGSAPGAALFFGVYTLANAELGQVLPGAPATAVHMAAATFGELAESIVRVPTEIVKQRMQASRYDRASDAVRSIWATCGVRGFFRGYVSTLARDVPFSLVQFPLYEYFKKQYGERVSRQPRPVEAAGAGSAAGAVAAALTTPLDVAKTRIMLSNDQSVRAPACAPASAGSCQLLMTSISLSVACTMLCSIQPTAQQLTFCRPAALDHTCRSQMNVSAMLLRIWREEGAGRLFSGVVPRVLWISCGGFFFFGCFEVVNRAVLRYGFREPVQEMRLRVRADSSNNGSCYQRTS